MTLVEISNLSIEFPNGREPVRPVEDVSLTLSQGELLALVGESGCGKTLTSLSLLGMVPPPGRVAAGASVRVADHDVLQLSGEELRRHRGGTVGMVFQDPGASLDPLMNARNHVVEALRAHRTLSRREAVQRAGELLSETGVPADRMDAWPHQLSGGLRQRVMIATALAGEPAVLVADEPTSALDVTVQAQILELLDRLRAQRGLAVLLVTHDLGIVADRADRVAVMYAGRIVESGPAPRIFQAPAHPYTRALLAALPRLERPAGTSQPIAGAVPHPTAWPPGCRFHPRCPDALPRCAVEAPPFFEVTGGHRSACWLAEEQP